MNNRRNFKVLMLVLIGGAAILLLTGMMVKAGPVRTLLMYLVIALGIAAILEGVMFAMKPGVFRDKVNQHPEDGTD